MEDIQTYCIVKNKNYAVIVYRVILSVFPTRNGNLMIVIIAEQKFHEKCMIDYLWSRLIKVSHANPYSNTRILSISLYEDCSSSQLINVQNKISTKSELRYHVNP